ncbi:MAG: PA0069 family radical SAM protein [Gammaproteobacteria bacterium]|nr:PA0069 family radical SAM protein [Gammaproteobacteria bacterium]
MLSAAGHPPLTTDDPSRPGKRKGRGAPANPSGRFLDAARETFDDGWSDGADPAALTDTLRTTVTTEHARSIISRNASPDIPFEQSINPYRGCEHGCIYCYARPAHAFVDLSPGLDFETRLFAKQNAAQLLEQELAAPGYRCSPISLGANTDPYQPIERRYRLTRALLEVLVAHRHPFTIVTKNAMVERDIDLIAPAARAGLAAVFVSVTTLDHDLARRLEPRATAPRRRVAAIKRLAAAGIPVGVMFAPVIPMLNDAELEAVLQAGAEAGAGAAGYVMLRLPREVRDLFVSWLAEHEPLKADRIMARVRDLRGGRDNDPRFGQRLRGTGPFADLIRQRFERAKRVNGLDRVRFELDTSQFRPPNEQLTLL